MQNCCSAISTPSALRSLHAGSSLSFTSPWFRSFPRCHRAVFASLFPRWSSFVYTPIELILLLTSWHLGGHRRCQFPPFIFSALLLWASNGCHHHDAPRLYPESLTPDVYTAMLLALSSFLQCKNKNLSPLWSGLTIAEWSNQCSKTGCLNRQLLPTYIRPKPHVPFQTACDPAQILGLSPRSSATQPFGSRLHQTRLKNTFNYKSASPKQPTLICAQCSNIPRGYCSSLLSCFLIEGSNWPREQTNEPTDAGKMLSSSFF